MSQIVSFRENFEKAEKKKAQEAMNPKKGSTLDVREAAERLKRMMGLFAEQKEVEKLTEEEKAELIGMAEFAEQESRDTKDKIEKIESALKRGAPVDGDHLLELQKQAKELDQCYVILTKAHSWLLGELTKRAGKRQRVTELIKKLARFKVGETKFGDLRQMADDARQLGVITQASDGPITLGYGERAVSYVPASDEPAVQEFVSAFNEFIGEFKEEGDRIRKTRMDEVAGFLFGNEEEYRKAKLHATKSLPDFLGGDGNMIFLPVEWRNAQKSSSDFLGEVMIQRRGSGMFATHGSNERVAHLVFGHPVNMGEPDEKWVCHGEQEVLFDKNENGISFAPTINKTLRYALQAKLEKDMVFQQRREASLRLRDVATVRAITMAEFIRGEEGTCIVNTRLSKGKDKKDFWVTLHLISDGEYARIGDIYEPKDLMGRLSWLKDYLEPKSVQVFSNDRRWQKIAEANRDFFECDWLLKREAEKMGAEELSKENIEGLCAISGTNGLCALTKATIGVGNNRTPFRVIVERKDEMVSVVWAAPGFSTRESSVGEFFPLNDLPKKLRSLIRNQYRFFLGLGGEAGLEKVPEHLKKEDKSSDADKEKDD